MKLRTMMVAAALLAVGVAAGCEKKGEAPATPPAKPEAKAVEAAPAAPPEGAPAKTAELTAPAAEAVPAAEAAAPAAEAKAGCGEAGKACGGAKGDGIADESVACKNDVPAEVAAAVAAAPVAEATEADKAKAAELAQLADKTQHFGAPFATNAYLGFGDLLANADAHTNKTVRVDATIKSVCRKAGCWMILADGADATKEVRVKMKDHAFGVPRDCDGKRTIVEGVFMKQVTPEAMLKHYEQDAGRDPSLVSGDKVEYVMIASGVDIISQ